MKKSQYSLICHKNERIELCICIYKMVNLLKAHDNLHGIKDKIKIIIIGIAIVKHWILR